MKHARREVSLSEEELGTFLRRKTRRDFLIAGVAAAGGIGAYEWMKSNEGDDGTPKLERRMLDLNGELSKAYLNNSRLMPSYSEAQVRPLKPNGNIGLHAPIEQEWRLKVITRFAPALTLSLSDVQALPKIDMITRFCCIEGWSTIVHWGGARLSDFTQKYFPPRERIPNYVYMATPDEEYYVGLDTKSAMHPQTLLAYEYNGKPLTTEHGAPLRLVIPVKYGIKNIKRIGSIKFTDEKPSDYWADEGYDWFAGL